MLKVKPFFKFVLLLSISVPAFADRCRQGEQSEFDCCEFQTSSNQTKISRIQTFDKTVCSLNVYSQNYSTDYRRFGFGSDGQVSVFLQPGGDKLKSNSSQSFLIFPFGENPTANVTFDQKVRVRSGSGQQWTFNPESALPISLEGCDIKVSFKFNLHDSGVKIPSCQKHLVIETPVEVGGEYIAYPDKILTVRDPGQKSCQIKNSDLYEYKMSGKSVKDKLGRYFSMKLKYKSNQEMGLKLKQLCPNLDVSMLLRENSSSSHQPAQTQVPVQN